MLNALLERLNDKHTIVLVTHDTGFVANITDRAFCLNKTLVEHPIDKNFSDIVASSYGSESSIVRHDKALEESATVKE
jgi:zinc transport system ATP-binding protein